MLTDIFKTLNLKSVVLIPMLGITFLHGEVFAQDLSSNPNLDVLLKTSSNAKSASQVNIGSVAKNSSHRKLGRFISAAMTPKLTIALKTESDSQSEESRFKATAYTRLRGLDEIQVYVRVRSVSENAIAQLENAGLDIEIVNEKLGKIQAWTSSATLQKLLTLDLVTKVSAPSYAISYKGSVTTEGDQILRGNELRELGITGKGVKVGILSDGSNNWQDAVATGDLPAQITRYGTCSIAATSADPENCISGLSGTCNEGTAMAEIIHDIAPEAELAIASVSSSLEFIQRAEQLANEFKADIIVDDLGFLGEPYYLDGDIAQALDNLPESVLLVSSAGNNAVRHYEDRLDFRQISGATIPGYHDFHPQKNDDPFHGFIVPGGTGTRIIMQWHEPTRAYDNSANDHSIQIYSPDDFLGETTFDNRGSFAFETACVYNPSSNDEVRFLVIPQPSSYRSINGDFTLFFLGSGAMEYPTARGSIIGHAALERVLTVGSINADDPGNDDITFYSSQGPSKVYAPGSAQFELRQKPDVTAIDGVSVSGAGRFSTKFFGTSAAAPHAAGVAALLKSVPFSEIGNVKQAILANAVDLGATGDDFVFGSGRIDALLARKALRVNNPLPAMFLLMLDDEEPDSQ